MHLRDGSPLLGLTFLGLVLVAAALLVAGYGAGVGVGVIVGLLLGAMAGIAFIGLSVRRSGRSWYGTYSPDSALSRAPTSEPDHELIHRYGRDSMRVMAVDAGALRRVIAIGSSVQASGARVELIAVEIREDGGVATFVAHTRPPVGNVGHFVDVSVSDDTGVAYVAAGHSSGGSGAQTSRHEVRFAPAPAEGVRVLILRVIRFVDPFPGPPISLEGPWEFNVKL